MGTICFITDTITPNYLQNSAYYKFRNPPLAFDGQRVHSNYLFWILYNNGIRNIKLLTDEKEILDNDIVFYHYNQKEKLNFNRPYKKIQILSDKPRDQRADAYCINSNCYKESEADFIISEPLPLGLTELTPTWPPVTFHCNCLKQWVPEFINNELENKINAKITLETNRQVSIINFDVFFFLRNFQATDKKDNNGSFTHLPILQKHANRLIQSWYLGVPGIFSYNPAMADLKKSELDYLEANNEKEFIDCCLKLKRDKSLFYAMIANGKKRRSDFTTELLIKQFNTVINHFSYKFVYE
jgi:hypothetical protein